ncbi:hypothetical protein N0V93_004555 [Gnomoniopsis smithogilvyi]|uniref:Uncharacterized protein n=1 Tax=Gnomoniopsis smithogilvyi TaxID=1191159 RepID=A0A9W8YRA0_9PEZI|nr:hypothetical protein N0V93_004555 [Gnomoniopsis smithogilvyi]
MGKLHTQKGLHLDLGSSAMRCAYFFNYGDGMLNHMIIKNDPNTTDEGEGIEGREMEHAVDIYPFDDGKPGQAFYQGNVPYPDRRSVSAKYAFYALVGMTDEMYTQYHLAADIDYYAKRDQAFKTRLERGVDSLLMAVLQRAKDLNGLLSLSNTMVTGDLMSLGDKSNAVLLFDMGGHATNSALMSVCRDKDQKPFLLELEKDVGASGGTRAWEYEILRKIKGNFLRDEEMKLPTMVENDLRVHFYRIKANIRQNKPLTLYAEDHGINQTVFQLTWKETYDAWMTAYSPTLKLITKQLKELKRQQEDYEIVRIIVSGGSSRHKILHDFFENECRILGINTDPFYMNSIGRDYEYARLALGASYATTKTPSVEEFLNTASFGLRLKFNWSANDGQTMYDWSEDALLMWSKNRRIWSYH